MGIMIAVVQIIVMNQRMSVNLSHAIPHISNATTVVVFLDGGSVIMMMTVAMVLMKLTVNLGIVQKANSAVTTVDVS
jgi:hypothetical protein